MMPGVSTLNLTEDLVQNDSLVILETSVVLLWLIAYQLRTTQFKMVEQTGHYAVADWRLRFVRSQSHERERRSAKNSKKPAIKWYTYMIACYTLFRIKRDNLFHYFSLVKSSENVLFFNGILPDFTSWKPKKFKKITILKQENWCSS